MLIHPDTLPFLSELKLNNDRDWFTANKPRFEAIRHTLETFLAVLIAEIHQFDELLGYPDPKSCIFRIYRDVRFSNDKSPYKTHLGSWMVRGGKNSSFAGYYLHLEPNNSFVSGGIYQPLPQVLKALREDIFDNPATLVEITKNAEFKSMFGSLQGDSLTRVPKGYPADFEQADWLKLKDLYVSRKIDDSLVNSDQLMPFVVDSFKAMYPVNSYFNSIIEQINA